MIRLSNVVKNYDDRDRVLDCVDMHVKKGSIYGLCGLNGAGKTTLIQHIAGIFRPDSGSVLVMGENVSESAGVRDRIGYVSDDVFYFHNYTLHNMAKHYSVIYSGWSWSRYEKYVNDFRLDDRKKLKEYSKGMKKQAYLILALSITPEILLLDEPVDGLDPMIRKKIWSIIIGEVADRKMTVLILSHNLRELEGVCDSIGIMKDGQIRIERDIEELKSDIHKIQVAFKDEVYDPFDGLNILHEDYRGSVKLLIVRNRREIIEEKIMKYNPLIFDVLPLTLEEIFIYEMGGGKDERILG